MRLIGKCRLPTLLPCRTHYPCEQSHSTIARCVPVFAGPLPEGQMRRLIAHQLRVSGQNHFALLNRIGGEWAGVVSLLAPGRTLEAPNNLRQA